MGEEEREGRDKPRHKIGQNCLNYFLGRKKGLNARIEGVSSSSGDGAPSRKRGVFNGLNGRDTYQMGTPNDQCVCCIIIESSFLPSLHSYTQCPL